MSGNADLAAADNTMTTEKTNQNPPSGKGGDLGPLDKIPDGWLAVIIIAILIILGVAGGLAKSVLLLAIVVGCVGGLIHDLIQNKAILLKPKTTAEGIYIGWILGIILGGAAGFIAIASGVASTTFEVQSLLAPFTAGIALKGITDAATNAVVKP